MTPLLLVSSKRTGDALSHLVCTLLPHVTMSEGDVAVWADQSMPADRVYPWLSGLLETRIASAATSPVDGLITVIVERINLDHLDPVQPDDWNCILARLILSFPDIRWIFAAIGGSAISKESKDCLEEFHSLAALVRACPSPLFDGSGLRDQIRACACNIPSRLPRRKQLAVALDEERAYADFHAYTAYRNGFRAFALTTDATARGLPEDMGITLTFEDIYLNFPDKTAKEGYSSLSTRDGWFPPLRDAGRRYFISVGHRFGVHQGLYSTDCQETICLLREEDRGGLVLNKPVAGMHAIWRETGLETKLEWFDVDDEGLRHIGVGDGYVWPPRPPNEDEPLESGGHSAPGRLLQVAEHLIHRAERLVGEVKCVQDAVRGAVLATDALELLGCRTPTLARDALELKHRFEVLAECQFGGVEFNLDLKPRFAEIRRDLTAICVWFGPDHRQSSLLNGELAVVSRLLTVFRDYNEYDEEDACLRRIRELQTCIWRTKFGMRILWLWPVWLVRRYVEWVIVSPQRLAGMITLWLAVICLGMHFAGYKSSGWELAGDAVKSFFGGEPTASVTIADANGKNIDAVKPWLALVTSIGVALGFLHLGIFISRIYSVISRK